MYPEWNYGIQQGEWVNPLASSYCLPIVEHLEELAKLYPVVSSWIHSNRISYLDRSVQYVVPAGSTLVQAVNLSGGFDCLVFTRQIAVINTSPPSGGVGAPVYTVLPNHEASYVEVQIARQAGTVDTEQAPANNNFGIGDEVNSRAVPEFWSGKDIREITITNNSAASVTVTLTYTLALL